MSQINMCFYCRQSDLEADMILYQELNPDEGQKAKIIYLCEDCNPSISYEYKIQIGES